MKIDDAYREHSYNEVIRDDCYRLRKLDFTPDLVIDLGANVGMFAKHAATLWPAATVVSVEPCAESYAEVVRVAVEHPNIHPIQAAVGVGKVYFREGANPGVNVFASGYVGYPQYMLEERAAYYRPCEISVVRLDTLVAGRSWNRLVVKIDVEGAEAVLIDDQPSDAILKKADYVCGELHYFAEDPLQVASAFWNRWEWMGRFRASHTVDVRTWDSGGEFWMRRREA